MSVECDICKSSMHVDARKCPTCGAERNKTVRNAKKVISVASSIIVVITAITLSASFFPDAYRNIFYQDRIDIHSIKTHISGGKGLITFQNTGSGDVFINEISFSPADNETYPLKDRNVIINEWVKRGEVRSMPYSAFAGAPDYNRWPYMQPEQFRKQYSELGTEKFDKARKYYRLEVFDREYSDPGVTPVINSINVQAVIRYSSLRSDGLKEYQSEKKLQGQIRYNEARINKVLTDTSGAEP